jgi:hypothetical protein
MEEGENEVERNEKQVSLEGLQERDEKSTYRSLSAALGERYNPRREAEKGKQVKQLLRRFGCAE